MAEKIVIAELDIDTEGIKNSMASLAIDNAKLKEQMKIISQSTNSLANATKEQAKEYLNLSAAVKKNNVEIKDGNAVLGEAEQKLKKQSELLDKEAKTINEAMKNNKELRLIRNTLNTKEDADKIKLLNEKMNENNAFIKSNSNELEKNKMNVGNYTQSITEALNKTGLFGASIGKLMAVKSVFGDRLKMIKTQMQILGNNMKTTGDAANTYAKGQSLAAKATLLTNGALKLFRLALMATGIGAIVVIFGSLISYLSTTQQGINKINSVLIPLKIIFQSMIGVIQKLGGAIFSMVTNVTPIIALFKKVGESISNTFSNPKQAVINLWKAIKENLVNRITAVGGVFKSLGKIISSGFTDGYKDFANAALQLGSGVEGVVDKVGGALKGVGDSLGKMKNEIGETVSEAVARGTKIAKLKRELSAEEEKFLKVTTAARLEYNKQNEIAEDVNKTIKEREAAALASVAAIKKETAAVAERNKKEVELMALEQQSNDTSDAEKAELQRKKNEAINQEAEATKKLTTQQNKLNTIKKEAQAKDKKSQEDEIALTKEIQSTLIEDYNAKIKIAEEGSAEQLRLKSELYKKQVEFLQDNLTAESALNKKRFDTQEITEKKYAANKVKLNQDTQKAINALLQKSADELLEVNKKQLDNEIKTAALKEEIRTRGKSVDSSEHDNRIKFLDAQYEKEKELAMLQIANKQELAIKLLEIDKQYAVDKESIDKKYSDYSLSQKANDLNKKNEQLIADGASEYEIKIAKLESEQILEEEKIRASSDFAAANVEERENMLSAISNKATAQRLEIELEAQSLRLQGAAQVAGGIAQLVGKETSLGKMASLTQATISTYEGATKALAQGGIAGAILAAIVVAAGLANVAKIMGVDTGGVESAASQLQSGATSIGRGVIRKKAERGGVFLLEGNRHSQGGINLSNDVEAEGGELMTILSRRQTELFLNHNKNQQPIQIVINQQNINTEELKEGVKEAVFEGSYQGTQGGAYDGITNSSQEGKFNTNVTADF